MEQEKNLEQETNESLVGSKNREDELFDENDFELQDGESEDSVSDDNDTNTAKEVADNADNEEVKKEQSRAENAYFAEMRRKQEAKKREQQIREETALETKLGLVKTNPYTHTPIKDKYDLEMYELQKAIEDEGGDPIADLSKHIANRKRAEIEAEKARMAKQKQQEQAEREALEKDIAEFRKKYPNVNTAELATDSRFIDIVAEKQGRWTTLEMYEYYLSSKKAEENSKQKQAEANKAEVERKAKEKTAAKLSKPPLPNSSGARHEDDEEVDTRTFEEYLNDMRGGRDFF